MNSGAKADVLLVLPVLQSGGAERVVYELARRLPEHGFAVSVVCLEDERAELGRKLLEAGVAVAGLRRSRFNTLICARDLRRWLPSRRPLIVHGHLFHANLATRLAIAGLRPDRVLGLSTVHVSERRFRPWQFLADRLTAQWVEGEVCVSRAALRYHQRRTGLPPHFFALVENGVDLGRFSPARRGGGAAPHVVSVGRLCRQKDYPTLLRAWQRVERELPAARLSIAGRGKQEAELRRLADRLHLRSVNWLGFAHDVPDLLRAADLYVQSSLWEGMPLSILEAMASALPVVATDADGVREVLSPAGAGMLVPRGDSQRLAEGMLHLLDNPVEASRLARLAQAEATSRFSVDRMVRRYAELYQEMLGRSDAARLPVTDRS